MRIAKGAKFFMLFIVLLVLLQGFFLLMDYKMENEYTEPKTHGTEGKAKTNSHNNGNTHKGGHRNDMNEREAIFADKFEDLGLKFELLAAKNLQDSSNEPCHNVCCRQAFVTYATTKRELFDGAAVVIHSLRNPKYHEATCRPSILIVPSTLFRHVPGSNSTVTVENAEDLLDLAVVEQKFKELGLTKLIIFEPKTHISTSKLNVLMMVSAWKMVDYETIILLQPYVMLHHNVEHELFPLLGAGHLADTENDDVFHRMFLTQSELGRTDQKNALEQFPLVAAVADMLREMETGWMLFDTSAMVIKPSMVTHDRLLSMATSNIYEKKLLPAYRNLDFDMDDGKVAWAELQEDQAIMNAFFVGRWRHMNGKNCALDIMSAWQLTGFNNGVNTIIRFYGKKYPHEKGGLNAETYNFEHYPAAKELHDTYTHRLSEIKKHFAL